jgi:hypothetical protein
MATTTKKTTTKAKAVVEETNEDVIETVENVETEEIKKPVITKEKKVFTDSDYILCRSVQSGGLNVVSQSGNLYRFRDYGTECEINYRDLVTMIRRGSEHVFLPRFIILDEDFLKEFPTVQRVYGTMYTREDLEEILELPVTHMKREIEKLPKSTKDSMRNLVATQIAKGKLDSISKVRALSEVFNSDFNLLSDLFVK